MLLYRMMLRIRTTKSCALLFILLFIFFHQPSAIAQNKVVVIPIAGSGSKPLKNIITVAKKNGDFSNPLQAVNSIIDASATNPYLVVIAPGVYNITSRIDMKEYVDVTGSGENTTQLVGGIGGDSWVDIPAIIQLASHSKISNLTIKNTGGNNYSYGIYGDRLEENSGLYHLTVMVTGGAEENYGIYINISDSFHINDVTATASGGKSNVGIKNYLGDKTIMRNVTATASGGTFWNTGIGNELSNWGRMSDVTAIASDGNESQGILNQYSSPVMTRVVATAHDGATNNYGVFNTGTSSPNMTLVEATAAGGTNSYGIFNDSPKSTPTLIEVTAIGRYGINAYGVYNSSNYTVTVRRSTLSCEYGQNTNTCKGLYSDSGSPGYTTDAYISQSTIIHGVGGTGGMFCVACDNGNGGALDASCN